jgi:acetyl esterase/lipase
VLLFTPLAHGQGNYPPKIRGAEIEVYKTVGDLDLKVWILNPKGHSRDDKTPAIVLFFGGGWNGGTPMHFNSQAQYFKNRGMVSIIVDYRVKNRNGVQAKFCVEDAKSAIRWVRTNAGRLGIDPDRIAAGGGSAGGHLSASTATLPMFDHPDEDLSVSSRPNALVLFNPVIVVGPVDGVEELEMLRQKHSVQRLGTKPENLSPLAQVGDDLPPTIIFHGTADTIAPHVGAVLFTKKAVSLGNRCELVSYEGAEHGFYNPGRDRGKPFKDTMRRADAFLVSLGYLEPKE